MGIALQLDRATREQIVREVLVNPQPKGDKVGAHCPFHQEKTPGGAFFYDLEKDVGSCLSCGNHDDLLAIWNMHHGRQPDDSDGYREFVQTYFRENAPTAKAKKAAKTMGPPPAWQPRPYDLPPERWSQKAGEWVEECCAALLRNDARLEQLYAWGILPETVAALKIGWHEGEKGGSTYRKFTHWGLPYCENEKGNERCVRLPRGFVFPGYRGSGDGRRVISMHVRPDCPEFENDPKYIRITGSGNHLYIFGEPHWKIWVTVETVRDAELLWQELAPLEVGAMAIGGASIRPDAEAHKILAGADLLLNAMDNDNAGKSNSWHFEPWNHGKFAWQTQYPNAVRWLVPSAIGKDVGDLPAAGVSVWDWFSAGLPDHILRRLEIRRDALARDGEAEGGADAGAEAAGEVAEAGAADGGAAGLAQGVAQGDEAVNQTERPVNQSGNAVTQKAQAAPVPPKRWESPRPARGVRYLPLPDAARIGDSAYEDYAQRLAENGSALLLEVQAGRIRKAVWPTNAPRVKGIEEGFNIMLRNDSEVTARIEQALKEAA
ncbi:hypothetical protein N1030_01810 [Desulfovibrio mangrovi]|uniref:hypothetical protein n=1 Tax=Desulfovibrio mangrovi TaxID=2976983 RepID=UPI002245B95A|nr:hypothetical protein [Desulfovibrio mangrovi]UZP67731.1 hypothetical protein N1030_01810 [Desulfovibrio mangrovi]